MKIWHIIISFFSIISVMVVVLSFNIEKDSELYRLAYFYDFAFCLVFFSDFLFQISQAKSKKEYFFKQGGIFDLLSSVPVLFEIRMLRLFRLFRLIRGARSYHEVRMFMMSNIQNMVYTIIFLVITSVIISTSFFVLYFEQDTGNINTAKDTIWWAFITVTTVGYGDYYPITDGGKIAAAILIFNGFIAFGTIISFINTKLSDLGGKLQK